MLKDRKPLPSRLPFLDWTRGFAAVVMLQGHAFHAFARRDLRDGSAYNLSQFVGGMPPAIFLFLTGITFAFLMESKARKGATAWLRVLAALRRSAYLFGIAFLFRLQLWTFALGESPWSDLFIVDILNSMGFAMLVMSPMAVFTARDRARLGIVLGALIAAAAPVISQLDWNGVHPFLRYYLVPDPRYFGFFPWAAFLAFGLSAGSILRLTSADQLSKVVQWGAMAGIVLIAGGQYFSGIPYSLYERSEFWVNSPGLVSIKLGVVLLISAFAYLWMQSYPPQKWSWVAQLGTTSLIVYWVHVELVYGRWLYAWRENLSVAETTAAAVGLIALMLALSLVQTRLKGRGFGLRMPWQPRPLPESAAGD